MKSWTKLSLAGVGLAGAGVGLVLWSGGAMRSEILSLFSVVDARDDARLDAGALQRYLAEAVRLPTALLPSENLRWSEIDDHRALATLTDASTTVSVEFRFNERGEVAGVFVQ